MSAATESPNLRLRPTPGDSSASDSGRAARGTIELSAAGAPAVPLLYVEFGSHLYVLPSTPPGSWFSAASREGEVVVRLPDGSHHVSSVLLQDDPRLLAHLEQLFRDKYGAEVWPRYFAGTGSALEIALGEPRLARTPLDRVRGEFDAAADTYDARVAQNAVERYLKDRVADLAVTALDGFDPILEIGPGTGYHTLRLLAEGHRVTAVDISERMLRRLRAAASRAGSSDRLETRQGSAAQIEAVLASAPDASFGGAFTAFGALDVEGRIEGFADTLLRLIGPGGRFAFTSLNRPGWGPFLWELAMARPSAAGARLRAMIPAGETRYPLPLYPRSPNDWDRLLARGFERSALTGVSTLAPPFDAHRPLTLLGSSGAQKLRRWDRWLSERRPGWSVAEWLFLTYRRLDNVPRPRAVIGDPSRQER